MSRSPFTLDGYGHGTPVMGDNLYNGTLDDAPLCRPLLIELAKTFSTRPLLALSSLCIFTGEEKGLLGSAYFTTAPDRSQRKHRP